MKKNVFAVAFCIVMSMGLAATAQAGGLDPVAAPIVIAADQSNTQDKAQNKGTVERCLKWVQRKVKVWVKDHYEVRTQAVCAVRG